MSRTDLDSILMELKAASSPENRAGMQRFGVSVENALGVKMPVIRAIARRYKKNHELAGQLWNTGIHEAKILSFCIADPACTSQAEADKWINVFNSWDECDQCCINILRKLPFCAGRISVWAQSDREFVKRTAFSMIAVAAVHWKDKPDKFFTDMFPLIEAASTDKRNYVKKR